MANLSFYFSDKLRKRHAPFLDFVQKMANRLMIGFYRYGPVNKRQNYLKRLKRSIEHYDRTGNTEFLLDAANYCWLEFCAPSHPDAHFEPSDSMGSRIIFQQQPRPWERYKQTEGD